MLLPREIRPEILQENLDNNIGVVLSRRGNPSFQNVFDEGVGAAIGGGEFLGNTTMQDGFLQSSNFVTGSAGWQLSPTSAELNVSTAILSLDIPDTTTANSFHVESDGDTYWGANVATGFAAAPASIGKDGAGKFTSITITGGDISGTPISGIPNNTSTDISLLEKTHDLTFSVTDANTVAWTSGTITLSNGRTFSISSGNTGNMAALTYIYLDPGVSSTVLQTTTTASTALGADKILLGTARNNTVTASFVPYGPGEPLIDGENIGNLSIVAGNIAASTITAGKMSVSQLSAVAADMGTLTAGKIDVGNIEINADSEQILFGSATAPLTGTGVFIGKDGADYEFRAGDPAGEYIHWNGSALAIKGISNVLKSFTAGETIAAGDALFVSDGTESEKVINQGSSDGDATITTTTWAAQEFVTSANANRLRQVTFNVNTTVSGVTYRCIIRSSLTGSNLATDDESLGVGAVDASFNFDLAVSASTTYYAIIHKVSGGTAAVREHSVSQYAGGIAHESTDSGSTWGTHPTAADLRFDIWENTTDSGRVYRSIDSTGTYTSGYYQKFFGFADEAGTAGNAMDVVVAGVNADQSGLSIGGQYYISTTLGDISTTPGSNSRKCGVAVSATEIQITNIW